MKIKFLPVSLLVCVSFMAIAAASAQTPPPADGATPTTPQANQVPMAAGTPDASTGAPPTATPTAPAAVVPIELRILKKVEEELKEKFKSDIYTPANISSLFFSPAQQSLLNSARQGMTNSLTNGPIEGLEDDSSSPEGVPIAPSVTSIFLSGIVYNAKDNWTIWLNGARLTPKTLPKEIIDINVDREFVELKWFDEATNQIFPVRLRPNQRFDLEQKTFLPGQ